MDIKLAIIITLAVVLLATIVLTVFLGIEKHYLPQIYETICKAYEDGVERGLKDVELKAYILQAMEDKTKEMGMPFKLIFILIKSLVKRYLEYRGE